MAVSYVNALQAFQSGAGTPVQTNPEQTRIIFLIPQIDAPLIKAPKEDADRLGIVSAGQLTDQPLQGRRGPVEGNGIVFNNLEENNGAGLWQSVHTNGKEVLIFNNATPEQFSQLQGFVENRLARDGDHLTLESLDAILRHASQIGLVDRYNSTVEAVTKGYEKVSFADSAPLQLPVKKPAKTKSLFIPAGTLLEWNPHGHTTEIYSNGSFLIVSKEEEGIAKELRHLNPDDAERKYQLPNGEAVKLRETGSPNVQVFSERVNKIERANDTTPPLPG